MSTDRTKCAPNPRKVYEPAELFIPERRKQTNGRGVGMCLLLWGIVLFLFEWHCGLSDWPMWAFRSVGLACLLLGAICFGNSFEKVKA